MKTWMKFFVLVWAIRHFAIGQFGAMEAFLASLSPDVAANVKIVASDKVVLIFYQKEA